MLAGFDPPTVSAQSCVYSCAIGALVDPSSTSEQSSTKNHPDIGLSIEPPQNGPVSQ